MFRTFSSIYKLFVLIRSIMQLNVIFSGITFQNFDLLTNNMWMSWIMPMQSLQYFSSTCGMCLNLWTRFCCTQTSVPSSLGLHEWMTITWQDIHIVDTGNVQVANGIVVGATHVHVHWHRVWQRWWDGLSSGSHVTVTVHAAHVV